MSKVTLLSYTPDPEKVVAAAAKLCYSPATIDSVMEGLTPEISAEFLDKLLSFGHESPFEHITFIFGVENVSRAFLAQVTRHRIASFSVQSQRYVAESHFDYVIPPEIEESAAAKEIFLKSMEESQARYEEIRDILIEKHTKAMMQGGMDEKTARGAARKKANEDARFVLPNACDTKMMMTFNARSLYNFFKHRGCNRAQWEIRAVAQEMLRLVYGVAPTVFKYAGPPCLNGPCPEGAMTCGKCAEVRALYKELKNQ